MDGQLRFGIHTTQPLSNIVAVMFEVKARYGVVAFSVGQSTLDDVFQKLVADKQSP